MLPKEQGSGNGQKEACHLSLYEAGGIPALDNAFRKLWLLERSLGLCRCSITFVKSPDTDHFFRVVEVAMGVRDRFRLRPVRPHITVRQKMAIPGVRLDHRVSMSDRTKVPLRPRSNTK